MGEPWQYGTFDCFKEMGNCVFGTFCPTCALAKAQENAEENSCPMNWFILVLASAIGCGPCYLVYLRKKIREGYNLEGDIPRDILCTLCCGCCNVIQLLNETSARGRAMN